MFINEVTSQGNAYNYNPFAVRTSKPDFSVVFIAHVPWRLMELLRYIFEGHELLGGIL